jgi:hypothetical protein
VPDYGLGVFGFLPQPLWQLSTSSSSCFATVFDLTRFSQPAGVHALCSGDLWLLRLLSNTMIFSANTVTSLVPRAITISALILFRNFDFLMKAYS